MICAELAVTVGGGHVGMMVTVLVKMAAEAVALAECALEAGDVDQHRKMGEAARVHMVFAREICAKDAKARAEGGKPHDPLASYIATSQVDPNSGSNEDPTDA